MKKVLIRFNYNDNMEKIIDVDTSICSDEEQLKNYIDKKFGVIDVEWYKILNNE